MPSRSSCCPTNPPRIRLAPAWPDGITPQLGLTDQQWRDAARGVEQIARAVRDETGLRTVVHHHCATYVETPAEIDRLLELTDPALVGLCLDSGHVTYGGGATRATCWRAIARAVWHVHFKSCKPADRRAGAHCRLGTIRRRCGTASSASLVAAPSTSPALLPDFRDTGFDGWIVVEQDVLPAMGSPVASATRNREYLRSIGLKIGFREVSKGSTRFRGFGATGPRVRVRREAS